MYSSCLSLVVWIHRHDDGEGDDDQIDGDGEDDDSDHDERNQDADGVQENSETKYLQYIFRSSSNPPAPLCSNRAEHRKPVRKLSFSQTSWTKRSLFYLTRLVHFPLFA